MVAHMTRTTALVLAIACAAVACKEKNPAYCTSSADCGDGRVCHLDGAPPLNACIEVSPDAPGIACTDGGGCPSGTPICRNRVCVACAGTECPAGRPVCSMDGTCGRCAQPVDCQSRADVRHQCEADAGACVECLTSANCTAAATPVCEAATCRACRADKECAIFCASDTGECVPDGDILYVQAGAAGAACIAAAPCPTIAAALSRVTPGKRWWISVGAGIYTESVAISGMDVSLIGSGARLVPPAGAGVTISGAANVWIRGFEITATEQGVKCTGAGASKTTVRLTEDHLTRNSGNGLDATNCAVVVERTIVEGGLGSQIGINLGTGCSFDLHDNVILSNRAGGITLMEPVTGGPSRFDFNTVIGNSNVGVACFVASMLDFRNNIVFGNGTQQTGGTNCTWHYSDIGPGVVATATNIDADPMFVQAGDYHISSLSPCYNTGDPAAAVGVDIDGDPRPLHGTADIGADEVK